MATDLSNAKSALQASLSGGAVLSPTGTSNIGTAKYALKQYQAGTLNPESAKKAQTTYMSGGLLSDIFDVIQTPQYFATGALKNFSQGKNILEGGIKGVKQQLSPSKAFDIDGWRGFAADVAFDPLNFVGIGGLTKLGKATQKGVKLADTLSDISKAGSKLSKGIDAVTTVIKSTPEIKLAETLGKQAELGQRALLTVFGQTVIKGEPVLKGLTKLGITAGDTAVGKALRTVFKKIPKNPVTGEAISLAGKSLDEVESILKANNMMQDVMRASKLIESQEIAKGVNFSKQISSDLKKLKKTSNITDDDITNLSIRINDKTSTVQIPKELEPILNRVNKWTDDMSRKFGVDTLANKSLVNLPVAESRDHLKDLSEGVIKPKGTLGNTISASYYKLGDDIVKESNGIATSLLDSTKTYTREGGDWVNEFGSKLKRSNATPQELNKVLEEAGSKLRFEEDISQQMLATTLSSARKQATTKFINETKGMGIKLADGAKPPAGYVTSQLPELKGYAFPKEQIRPIEGVFTAYSDPKHMNKFFKAMSKVQGPLKLMQTALNLPFHVRNKISNLWQMSLDDVSHILYEPTAIATFASEYLGKKSKTFTNMMGKSKKYLDEFEALGLKGSGWEGVDVGKDITGFATKLRDNPILNLPRNLGGFLEDTSKFSMYLSLRKKGWAPENAAMQVKKFLFDYGDLTDTERNVLKQIFPYYTWSRKNLPLQVAMMIQKPTKVSLVDKARKNYEANQKGEKMDYSLMPEWLKDAYPVWKGEKDGINQFVRLQGFVPTLDLDMLVTNPVQTGLDMASPLLKTPVEMLTNYDFYFRDQIKDYEGQKTEFLGQQMDPYLVKLLKTTRVPGELQRISNIDEDYSAMQYLTGAKTYDIDPAKKQSQLDIKSKELVERIRTDMKYVDKNATNYDAIKRAMSTLEKYEEAKGKQDYYNRVDPNGSWDKKNYDVLIPQAQAELERLRIEGGVDMAKIKSLEDAIERARAGEGIRIT